MLYMGTDTVPDEELFFYSWDSGGSPQGQIKER